MWQKSPQRHIRTENTSLLVEFSGREHLGQAWWNNPSGDAEPCDLMWHLPSFWSSPYKGLNRLSFDWPILDSGQELCMTATLRSGLFWLVVLCGKAVNNPKIILTLVLAWKIVEQILEEQQAESSATGIVPSSGLHSHTSSNVLLGLAGFSTLTIIVYHLLNYYSISMSQVLVGSVLHVGKLGPRG